jgi:hypothetical protein
MYWETGREWGVYMVLRMKEVQKFKKFKSTSCTHTTSIAYVFVTTPLSVPKPKGSELQEINCRPPKHVVEAVNVLSAVVQAGSVYVTVVIVDPPEIKGRKLINCKI